MIRLILFLCGMCLVQFVNGADDIVVIGHPGLPRTDQGTLQRLYTGRVVSVSEEPALPLNLAPGDPTRRSFLETILGQSEEQYTGYWLVRRYVGKGAPPQEVTSVDELIRRVGTTPGAVGYVPASKVPAGANVIFRRSP